MQAESFGRFGMWSGADVCPASLCGRSRAAGPYGDARIEVQYAFARSKRRQCDLVFLIPSR